MPVLVNDLHELDAGVLVGVKEISKVDFLHGLLILSGVLFFNGSGLCQTLGAQRMVGPLHLTIQASVDPCLHDQVGFVP